MKIKLNEQHAANIREVRDDLDAQHGVKENYRLRFGLIAFQKMTGFTNTEIWTRFRESPYCVHLTSCDIRKGIIDTKNIQSLSECTECN